jgi:hypothetical protein
VKVGVTAALCIAVSEPALGCSGFPTRYFQIEADVIVAGKLAPAPTWDKPIVLPRKVLKGVKQPSYSIVWPTFDSNDECAFLSPVVLDRGVYFLKRREDGAYDVLTSEKRWKMVR